MNHKGLKSNKCKRLQKNSMSLMRSCCFPLFFLMTLGSRDASAVFTGIDFVDMKDECVTATEEQIKKEITASLKYLSMGAFFSKDNINRPGFAKLFFEAASEEREHAYKLIEYLSMRGRYLRQKDNQWKSKILNFDISQLVKDSEKLSVMNMNLVELTPLANEKTTSGLIALQNALKLETAVTKSIRALIQSCEGDEFNHYHVSFHHNC